MALSFSGGFVMRIAVLGTGSVGNTVGTKLVSLGHEVKMGSRDAANPKAAAWVAGAGAKASAGTFEDAAKFGELIVNATSGQGAMAALKAAGAENLRGKIVIDISNPLDFSKGMPPTLTVTNTDSLGEQLQRAFPEAKIVKTLNTINAALMVAPGDLAGGEHDMFLCGNDASAKAKVSEILRGWFGWKHLVDLGDITNARATEGILPLWVRLYGNLKTPHFSLRVVR
jgi:predicted dinucleotide-binding enzyme